MSSPSITLGYWLEERGQQMPCPGCNVLTQRKEKDIRPGNPQIWVQENTAILRGISSCWLRYVLILIYNILYHYHMFVGPLAFFIVQLMCPQVFITVEDPAWSESSGVSLRLGCPECWFTMHVRIDEAIFLSIQQSPNPRLKKGGVSLYKQRKSNF